MIIVLLGMPGCGKGTQAELLTKYYNIPHISTGDLFRKEIANKTELGVLAQSYIDNGHFVPDEVSINMLKNRISNEDCKNGYILDGFPRTIPQAVELDKFAKVDIAILLDVDENEVRERALSRRTCKDCGYIYNTSWNLGYEKCPKCGGEFGVRSDDNEQTYKNRYEVYERETLPILGYFKNEGKVVTVKCEDNPEESYKKMIAAFKASNISGLKEFLEG